MSKEEIITALHNLIQDVSLETALFQQKVAAKAGLSVNDMRALSILMKHGNLSATALSKKLGVTNGAVTGIVERLRRKKLVYRQPSKNDGRAMAIHPNYQEIMAGASDYQKIGEAYHELLSTYTVKELRVILDYTKRTHALTKQQRIELE